MDSICLGGFVGDVKLPPWAHGDAKIFIRKHRQALESKHVSENLHHWVDLIFGYKQQGKAAIEAQNMFYYLTYHGRVDVNKIADPLEKMATIAQINNFGQTPKQLFTKPSPARKKFTPPLTLSLNHVHMLKPTPERRFLQRVNQVVVTKDKLVVVDGNKCAIGPTYSKYISWGHADHSLRFSTREPSFRHRRPQETVAVHEKCHDGQIVCATSAVVADAEKFIITGGQDSVLAVWQLHPKFKHNQLKLRSRLYGHSGTILCVLASVPFGVIVSGDEDGSVIIWDLNRLEMNRTLPLHPALVTAMAINQVTGDIATCSDTSIFLWTLNGDLIGCTSVEGDSPLSSNLTPAPFTPASYLSSMCSNTITAVAFSAG